MNPRWRDIVSGKRQNVFISFDYDNDLQLKEGLIGQSHNDDSPFNVADFSMKEAAPQSKWRKEARERIERCSVVIVMCGRYTDKASGVSAEVRLRENWTSPTSSCGDTKRRSAGSPKRPSLPTRCTSGLEELGVASCRTPLEATGLPCGKPTSRPPRTPVSAGKP